MKPFIKWVGGKTQLLPEIEKRLPDSYTTYYEPFIGGGSVLLHLQPQRAVISDLNWELMNTYKQIKHNHKRVLEILNRFKEKPVCRTFYDALAGMDRQPNWSKVPDVMKAARFIYLNKTGFNGLYRVNKSGQYNAPFGKYDDSVRLYDKGNIEQISEYLQNVSIQYGNYSDILNNTEPGSFVYLDPPYHPVSKTSNFTGYTQHYSDDFQLALRDYCVALDNKSVKFMLSNSYCPEILDLYKDFNVHTVSAARMVNSKGDGRGKVKEVLVTNY